jgi:dihydrofolate reductase
MRKLVESTFASLDGVIGSPEKWSGAYWDDDHDQYARKLLFAADALLLGRETYEVFANSWPSRTGDEYSDRINSLPKYVASTTLQEARWNATVIKGDVGDEVAKLKQQPGQNILKFGTGELGRTLMRRNLIDEFHIWLFPIVVGSGTRLFEEGVTPTSMQLVDTTTFRSGIVVLTYAPK